MTHAEEVARLEEAVVEAAKALWGGIGVIPNQPMWADGDVVKSDGAHLLNVLHNKTDSLISAEALTCEECEGNGRIDRPDSYEWAVCHACHGTGRKECNSVSEDVEKGA